MMKIKAILYTGLLACWAFTAPLQTLLFAGGLPPVHIWEAIPAQRHDVLLTPYLADSGTPGKGTSAVIVCPGGSYSWLSRETEGHGVARWLQENGISAFVLEYRVQGVPSFVTHYRLVARGVQYPDALRDLQRSIQIVRERAEELGIDPERLGVMGFSAGGHLVMSAGEFFGTDFLSPLGIVSQVSLRPDFVVPVYPVVTMSDARYVHKRSRRALLGEWGKFRQSLRDSLSLEKHVRPDTPPVFLVNCVDDPTVKYQNSVLLDSALTAEDIPHWYLQFHTGGHGFGADEEKASPECIEWKNEFLLWQQSLWQSDSRNVTYKRTAR